MKKVYIDRDKNGKITATYARKQREGQENIDETSQEIVNFKTPPAINIWSAKEQFQYMYENGFDAWKIEYENRLNKDEI